MKKNPNDCFHLNVSIVEEVHLAAIKNFGGSLGIRDHHLLESAVSAPQASFGGQSPYVDLIEIAAAYLFYLCKNHPFIDGNKRTALASCLLFMELNGIEPYEDGPHWEKLTLDIASSKILRNEVTEVLRKFVKN